MKFLIIGLGNIGTEYEQTRHNIGFMVLDELAKKHNAKLLLDKKAFFGGFKLKNKEVYLIKPTTFMNLSGDAVRLWMQQLKISVENILVITDDIALPFQTIRTKPKGSHGGHNGLRDIEAKIGTQTYPRLRMGVGDNFPKGAQAHYVLSKFNIEEFAALPFVIDKAVESTECFILEGIQAAMTKFNS